MSSIQQNSMFSLMPYLENCPFFPYRLDDVQKPSQLYIKMTYFFEGKIP